ncbi:MAG TPA: hypothetical protein VNC41_08430 [Acidimicrobiia bacterium]|nr:hypothetical protein [Acidimicrobiia bacterium]
MDSSATSDQVESHRRQSPPAGDAAGAKARATTEMILAMPVGDRLRQIEAEANFFSSVRPLDD